jgi:hypothetical protein
MTTTQTTFTTITDAIRTVSSWVEAYDEQPTPEQIETVARALVDHVGGYGVAFGRDLTDAFDVDAALAEAGY